MRLFLIRHARPDVTDGICYGRTDLPVRPEEHRTVLTQLMQALPRRVPIFSSPLKRCSELAALLVEPLGSKAVIHDTRLAEMDFGAWEMRAWTDIPRAEIDAWAAGLHSYRPGGGESVLGVAYRVRQLLNELQAQQPDSVIVVCHAGTIRVLLACLSHSTLMDVARAAAQVPHSIGYGELIALDC
ncbi:histidine phosphatase family protein [Herbaspirillum sp. ST 5-3]|uniref:histidine phosphatase family protein n=1 Tax=Oxalobacteraceae TaxID=75682 RepID=UPI0010A5399A|nr:histidine phosphatase family protein [Herbaspirillum sp. ST 5-3]